VANECAKKPTGTTRFALKKLINKKKNKKRTQKVAPADSNGLQPVKAGFHDCTESEENEIERNGQMHNMIFNTPISSNVSASEHHHQSSQLNTKKSPNMNSMSHSYLNSTCCTYNVPTTSCSTSYDAGDDDESNTCFLTGSVINSTPTNSYASSMVTYNTKYAGANNSNLTDEDGLMSVSCMMGEAKVQTGTKSVEQSTPFTENFAKIKNLKTAEATEPTKLNTLTRKCRRSNTTYTIANLNKNNQIIDYFNRLELSKPVKKQALIRKLHGKDENVNNTIESVNKKLNGSNNNEIEKIQDVLFYDEENSSLMQNTYTNKSFGDNTNEFSLNNNAGSQHEPELLDTMCSIDSCMITDDSTNVSNNSRHLLSKSKQTINPSKLNETRLVNVSVEKLRRSLSFPTFSQNNSPLNVDKQNESKIENLDENSLGQLMGRSAEESKLVAVGETSIKTLIPDEMETKGQENVSSSTNKKHKQPFVRGDPQTRLSKNIKQMFKHVVMYQMNALSSLEKLYESQMAKLELDRQRNISVNPHNTEKINVYFNNQIKLLEERVQNSLKVICESKAVSQQSSAAETNQAPVSNKSGTLSRRLSQLLLLKQIEMQQKKQDKQMNATSTSSRMPRSHLVSLKTNLLTVNQNNILPSKKLRQQSSNLHENQASSARNFESGSDLKDAFFKRHLSLPYQQCGRNVTTAMLLNKQLTERINSNNSLRFARAAAANKQNESGKKNATSHTLPHSVSSTNRTAVSVGRQQQRDSSLSQFKLSFGQNCNFELRNTNSNENSKISLNQYQKNALFIKKQSTSNDNISKLRATSQINTNNSSAESSIKRQNKSTCSLSKQHPEFSPSSSEHNDLSHIHQLTNESSLMLNAFQSNHVNFVNSSKISSNFSGTFSKSNCSLFSNSNLDSTNCNNNSHLVKYQPPRFSDSHIQFRLNQQKIQLIKSATEFKKVASNLNNICRTSSENETAKIKPLCAQQMDFASSSSNKLNGNFLIETQV